MGAVRSPWSDVTIPEDVSCCQLILARANSEPDRLALINALSGKSLTYGQLAQTVRNVGSENHPAMVNLLTNRPVAPTKQDIATTGYTYLNKEREIWPRNRFQMLLKKVGLRDSCWNVEMGAVRSPWSDVTIPEDVSCCQLILARANSEPDRLALINALSGKSLTYGQLAQTVRNVGSAMTRMGLQKGDVVCVCSTNSPQMVVAMFGVLSIGAVVTGMNPALNPDEMVIQLNDARPVCFITSSESKRQVEEIKKIYSGLKDVIFFGGVDGYPSFDELMEDDGTAFPEVRINPREDIALLPYSSGTTGLPKGVMLTHYNVVADVVSLSHPDVAFIGERQVVAPAFQLYHSGGFLLGMFYSLNQLATIVLLPTYTFEGYLRAIHTYKVTTGLMVPPIFVRLAKDPLVDKYDISTLRHIAVGAAPLSEHVTKEVCKRLGTNDIKQAYGMTECVSVSHVTPKGVVNYATVGKAIPNLECKVIDVDSGATLGPMQRGEVCVRGPMVMAGYLRRPDATANTVDTERWLHTGDMGYMDQSDFLFIVDRYKELIKYKGYQVAPAELEALILRHPDVAEAAVVGIPDTNAGQLPRAYIVGKSNRTVVPSEIAQFLADHVAPYKRLRGGVIIVDKIPKTGSGKLLKRHLRDQTVAAPVKSRL